MDGARNRQQRAKFRLPPDVEMANLRELATASGGKLDAEKASFNTILPKRPTWKDIEWLQSLTKLPVLIKGVLDPDDAAWR